MKKETIQKLAELRRNETLIIAHIKKLYAKTPKCFQRDMAIDNLKIELENIQKDILDLL